MKENLKISYDFVCPGYDITSIWRFAICFLNACFFPKKNSVVVIQKVHSNGIYARLLKLLVKIRPQHTLYDLDDAEYIRKPGHNIDFFIRNCELVSVGSPVLKQYAQQFNPNVFLQTSPVVDHFEFKERRNRVLTIGWLGDYGNGNPKGAGFSHRTSLNQLIFPALLKLEVPIKFVLLGIKLKEDLETVKQMLAANPLIEVVLPYPNLWENDMWVYEEVKAWDLGLSPLVPHPFNEAKSAFKLKQYLSCGVPVLGSSTGENATFIHDGKNGFICDSMEAYRARILQFYHMSDQKFSLFSMNARASIPEFSMENYCSNLLRWEADEAIEVARIS
ncbi:MAG: hypothetical protein AAGI38_06425 [Bacteroidota bacterium]